MKTPVILAAALALAASACSSSRPSAASFYAEHLRDINRWDPVRGAEGHYAYEAMLIDPSESVPILIAKLADMSPTAIYDGLHDAVPVADVAFHILLRIFSMKPEAFDREGVWIMRSDPSNNPIYQVKFRDEESRARVAGRFRFMAVERGWYPSDE